MNKCLECNGVERPLYRKNSKNKTVCLLCLDTYKGKFFKHLRFCENKENFILCVCKAKSVI